MRVDIKNLSLSSVLVKCGIVNNAMNSRDKDIRPHNTSRYCVREGGWIASPLKEYVKIPIILTIPDGSEVTNISLHP